MYDSNGMVENSGRMVQIITTSRKPSRVCSSRLPLRENIHSTSPDRNVTTIASS